ncbi:MAG: sugar phosphate isomerase/epimerase [Pseudomonadota bacterium]
MVHYAYQLSASRKFGPIRETLSMVREFGYRGVEGYTSLFQDPAMVDRIDIGMGASGLVMRSCQVSFEELKQRPGRLIDIAHHLGILTYFVSQVPLSQRPYNSDGWQAFSAELKRSAGPLRAVGIAVGWHNYDYEFVALENERKPIEILLESDQALVWQLDIGWLDEAGEDPLSWMARYRDRITSVHMRDRSVPGEGLEDDGWADVGHGTLAWPSLLAAMNRIGVVQRVIAHENPSDDRRFAARSISAMKSMERSLAGAA